MLSTQFNELLLLLVFAALPSSQSDILDKGADNMAVRMALAETHIVKETKDFLVSVRQGTAFALLQFVCLTLSNTNRRE